MPTDAQDAIRHFREAFRSNPTAAYRDWFRLQEELRETEDTTLPRTLADDLWTLLSELSFPSE